MNTYILIPGGESFLDDSDYQDFITSTLVDWNSSAFFIWEEQKKWKIELARKLTEKGNLVYIPTFPNAINAHYNEWKVFFDAWIEKIEIVWTLTLIWHSLGGNFLLKYFWEIEKYDGNPQAETPEKINLLFIENIHLVAACISEWDFAAPENYDTLRSLGSKVHIWHTEDDTVVPFAIAKQLRKELLEAQTHFFGFEKWYGHFSPLAVFPEFEDILLQK